MKKQNVFAGIILIGFGAYFLLHLWHIPFLDAFNSWPTFLIIIGLAFFIQAFFSKHDNNLFIAVILLGLGIHFHFLGRVSWWPNGWAVYTFIFGIAFLARYYKSHKDGLVPGVILLALSLLDFFYAGFQVVAQNLFGTLGSLWPLLLVAGGLYLIFKKK